MIRAVGHRIESISVFRVLFHKRHELITSGDDSDITLRLEYNNPRCLAGNDPLHLAEMKQVVTVSALRPPPKIRVLVFPLWLRAKLSRREKKKGLLILVAAFTLSSFIYVHGPQLCLPLTAIFIFIIFDSALNILHVSPRRKKGLEP